jgi:hypothetical protein
MKWKTFVVSFSIIVISAVNLSAFSGQKRNNIHSHSIQSNNGSIAIHCAGSNDKRVKSLSKTFQNGNPKLCRSISLPKTGTDQQLNMQRLNKYQYRRSHSRKPGIPIVRVNQ